MRKMWIFPGILLILFLVLWKVDVCAAETDLEERFLDELNLEEIDAAFRDLQGREQFRFTEAVKSLIQGEEPLTKENLLRLVKDTLFSSLQEKRGMAVRILMIVAVAAIFTNFTNAFEKSQAADVSFYMMYLCLFTLLMQMFQDMSAMTLDTLNHVITFMKLLMPSYLLASVFAGGSMTGTGFYELTLGMILIIQWIVKYAVMPAIHLYVLFSMLNHLTSEDYLSKLADLLKTFVEWILKTLAALAIGVQTVQCLVLPAADSLKTSALTRTVGAVPGLGNVFNGVTEVVLGSAVLIKNAVGAAGLIFLAVLCLVPLLKLGAGALLYRLIAAVVQPVSNKCMVECIESAGEGAGLLMKALLTVGVLFFLSVAMATASIR